MNLKGKLWVRILAIFLAGILAVAAAGMSLFTAHIAVEYCMDTDEDYVYSRNCSENYEMYLGYARDYFCLLENQDHLSYAGRQYMNDLSERLDPKNTNFRFRIYTLEGEVLFSNFISREESDPLRGSNSRYFDYEIYLENYVASYLYAAPFSTAPEEMTGATDLPTETPEAVTTLLVEYGLDPEFAAVDEFSAGAQQTEYFQASFNLYLILSAAALAALIFLTVWLTAAAGHKAGVEGIHVSSLHRIPFDLWLIAGILITIPAGVLGILILDSFLYFTPHFQSAAFLCVGFGALVGAYYLLVFLPLLTTFAVRCKARTLLKTLLISYIFRFFRRLFRCLRLSWRAGLVTAGYLFLLILCAVMMPFYTVVSLFLTALLALVGLAGILFWCAGFQRLRRGSKNIAAGDLDYRIDTRHLPSDLKEHAEDLNSISLGLRRAVEEQRKSDLFQAELITNVSHDLKTPLTSVINYVDLLKKLELEDETAGEYIDVLDRKSQQLKVLTEDLVEASKASSGVLQVNAARISLNQCIQQACAEYADRLEEAQLTLVSELPRETVYVNADGRHLWRIFDNLFSNCVKYAMPATRVYLTVFLQEEQVVSEMKNISRDALNISADQLLSRFVRGDSSRHTEGSGLGLSIAKSLAGLQDGAFRLEVDGDLFKAQLTLPIAKD